MYHYVSTPPDEADAIRRDLSVSPELFETDEKGTHLTKKGKEQLHHLVLGISGEMLREGVEIKKAGEEQVGMRIRMVGEDVEIDLTENAISDVLLKYLLPRYRAIVAGVE